jgi:hypothetical protein
MMLAAFLDSKNVNAELTKWKNTMADTAEFLNRC